MNIIPSVRGQDDYGNGAYLASRKGGKRKHKGVDFACYAGSTLKSPVDGVLERIGHPYSLYSTKGYLSLMEIRVDQDTTIKIMYVKPLVEVGKSIQAGQDIAIVQDLTKSYPAVIINGRIKNAMTNHYHLEVWVGSEHVNPIGWLSQYKDKNDAPSLGANNWYSSEEHY